MMELLREHAAWIASNPWGAGTLAVGLAMVVWGMARAFYTRETAVVKATLDQMRAEAQRVRTDAPATTLASFVYPDSTRHGLNALARHVGAIRIGESLSMRAVVPPGSGLRVLLTGPQPADLADATGAWTYTTTTLNWSDQGYIEVGDGRPPQQTFVADEGIADLALHLKRAGEVRFDVFEGAARTVSWSKTIRVIN